MNIPRTCLGLESPLNLHFATLVFLIRQVSLDSVSKGATVEHFGPNSQIPSLHLTQIVGCYPEGALHFERTLLPDTTPCRCCFLVHDMSVSGSVTLGEVTLRAIKVKRE